MPERKVIVETLAQIICDTAPKFTAGIVLWNDTVTRGRAHRWLYEKAEMESRPRARVLQAEGLDRVGGLAKPPTRQRLRVTFTSAVPATCRATPSPWCDHRARREPTHPSLDSGKQDVRGCCSPVQPHRPSAPGCSAARDPDDPDDRSGRRRDERLIRADDCRGDRHHPSPRPSRDRLDRPTNPEVGCRDGPVGLAGRDPDDRGDRSASCCRGDYRPSQDRADLGPGALQAE